MLYGCVTRGDSPFIRDVPRRRGPRGLAATPAPPAGARRGCPPSRVRARRRGRPGHGRPGLGPPLVAARSTPPRWTASPSAPPTPSARARPLRCSCARDYDVVDTGDPMPAGATRSSCASTCTTAGAGRAPSCAPPSPPYQHVRSIGEDVAAGELLLPEGHRLRAVDLAAAAAAGATSLLVRRAPRRGGPADRRRGPAARVRPAAGGDPGHQLADARRPGTRGRLRRRRAADRAGRPGPHRGGRPRGGRGADLVLVVAGSSAGRDDYTARVVADARHARGARCRRPARTPGRARRGRPHPRWWAARATPCRPR